MILLARSSLCDRCMMVIRAAVGLFLRVLHTFRHHSCTTARLVSLATSIQIVRVIAHQNVPAASCAASVNACRHTKTTSIVFHFCDPIHVTRELPAIPPSLLIPGRAH